MILSAVPLRIRLGLLKVSNLSGQSWRCSQRPARIFYLYAFRNPFTAATYEGATIAGIGLKTVLVTAQVIGYPGYVACRLMKGTFRHSGRILAFFTTACVITCTMSIGSLLFCSLYFNSSRLSQMAASNEAAT